MLNPWLDTNYEIPLVGNMPDSKLTDEVMVWNSDDLFYCRTFEHAPQQGTRIVAHDPLVDPEKPHQLTIVRNHVPILLEKGYPGIKWAHGFWAVDKERVIRVGYAAVSNQLGVVVELLASEIHRQHWNKISIGFIKNEASGYEMPNLKGLNIRQYKSQQTVTLKEHQASVTADPRLAYLN